MSSEPEESPQPATEADEKQLCISCMFPNEPSAHFCAKCGAPLTSFASTGPFEHLFAEGHVYRQAAERPHKLIVVLGVWFIFGMMATAGMVLVITGRDMGILYTAFGALMVVFSVALIWKTTRNYLARGKTDTKHDG